MAISTIESLETYWRKSIAKSICAWNIEKVQKPCNCNIHVYIEMWHNLVSQYKEICQGVKTVHVHYSTKLHIYFYKHCLIKHHLQLAEIFINATFILYSSVYCTFIGTSGVENNKHSIIHMDTSYFSVFSDAGICHQEIIFAVVLLHHYRKQIHSKWNTAFPSINLKLCFFQWHIKHPKCSVSKHLKEISVDNTLW